MRIATQGDVAACAGPYGVGGSVLVTEVARINVDHTVAGEGGSDGGPGHLSVHFPEQVAVEVVGADTVHSRGDDFGSLFVFPDIRGRPT